MATHSVEVVYRGVFQRSLARNICRSLVLAATNDGRTGITFSRYSDSPERNGVPAKQFAVVADSEEEMEASMAQYEPARVDVTIALDDTLGKGLESWAWNGLQPVNRLTRPGGTLLVTSVRDHASLLRDIHRKDATYQLSLIRGVASFSGLWVFKDDRTDVRVLGALSRVCPEVVSLDSVLRVIREQWKSEEKVAAARTAFDHVRTRVVEPGEGNPEPPVSYTLPGWHDMREALVVPGAPLGGTFRGDGGGYQPGRNPTYKRFSTRTMRPVVNFDTCTKCTLCWAHCPDEAFDVTPEGLYDPNMEACVGCGICEEVCPVKGCVVMVNEAAFQGNASQYEAWRRDPGAYQTWRAERAAAAQAESREHGFHHTGQYAEEAARRKATEVTP